MMETLLSSEQEQRLYTELFSVCDVEKAGRVTGIKAAELFLTSGLTQERLQQITEVCGAKKIGHFGRREFFLALKFIAASQAGLPVTFESLNSGMEIPLPKFGWQYEQDGRTAHAQFQQNLPPPPKHARPIRNSQSIDQNLQDPGSQEAKSPPFSPSKDSPPPLSPLSGHPPPTPPHPQPAHIQQQAHPHIIHKPKPVHASQHSNPPAPNAQPPPPHNNHYSGNHYLNSVNNRNDGPHHRLGEEQWTAFAPEEEGLISGEVKDSKWANFPSEHKFDTSSISSEAESIDDVWAITDDQREYYINQFKNMQSDLNGVISGSTAKGFFEKSKLPINELKHIWQLSDQDRDGCLSLEEFCIAMHLVVLRRNDIELPEHLPPALLPYASLQNINPEDSMYTSEITQGTPMKKTTSPNVQQQYQTVVTSHQQQQQQQWMLQKDSPTVGSPVTKPVNFEFKPVVPGPELVHPVAMRMSPDGHLVRDDGQQYPVPNASFDAAGRLMPPPPSQPGTQDDTKNQPSEPSAPAPPPRRTGHSRSSSMDNQLVDIPTSELSQHTAAPPAVPPRSKEGQQSQAGTKLVSQASMPNYPYYAPEQASNDNNFADFAKFDRSRVGQQQILAGQGEGQLVDLQKDRHKRSTSLDFSHPAQQGTHAQPENGKNSTENIVGTPDTLNDDSPIRDDAFVDDSDKQIASVTMLRQASCEKKDIEIALRRQRDRNTMLTTLNSELNQELQEVMEQRIALEIQLEHLNNKYSS